MIPVYDFDVLWKLHMQEDKVIEGCMTTLFDSISKRKIIYPSTNHKITYEVY